MAGTDDIPRNPKTLYTFNSAEDISQYATGCDADMGGLSTVHIELDEVNTLSDIQPGSSVLPELLQGIPRPTGKFWGDMRLRVQPAMEGKIRPGYAGFRNKVGMK